MTLPRYDTHGVFSSPRALFMFKAFGHHKSSILDGGLPRWEAEGFPVEIQPPVEAKKSQYPTPKFDKDAVRSKNSIQMSIYVTYHI
jgi:thiosulfate/3-mercaptopyruvate sulfurtransferase